MDNVRVPIIVGVTGHRDIPKEDEKVIHDVIFRYLIELKNKYPYSPFRLISGLAEGADRLVAEVALEVGFGLLAALPMEQTEYEKDFQTPDSLAQFHSLIDRADNCFVVESAPEQARNEKYLALGYYIARHSQIVIALWDGVSEQVVPDGPPRILKGGTADVVRLCLGGFSSSDDEMMLEKTQVDHLYVRRINQQNTQDKPSIARVGEWVNLSGSEEDRKERVRVAAMMRAINQLNECADSVSPDKINQSRKRLITNAPRGTAEHLKLPIDTYLAVSGVARLRQSQKTQAVIFISSLAIVSIVCQQVYSGPDMRWGWLAGHISLAIFAFIAFFRFFKGEHPREEQYLDWRAMAEGLRVQIFWLAAGVRASVDEHYLSIYKGGYLDWIRQALRNSVIGIEPIKDTEALQWVGHAWLKAQYSYFKESAEKNNNLCRRFLNLTKMFFLSALTITVATLVAHLADASDAVLNGFVLTSGLCFLSSAILKTYAEQMSFEEQMHGYKIMETFFDSALKKFNAAMEINDHDVARGVLQRIGKEALSENAGWLHLHRQRQFQPPSA